MLITPFLVCFALIALSARAERSVDIFVWPLSASQSHSLAHISYNAANATVDKYTPPEIPADDDVVRIGFYHASGSWSGVATAASNFSPGKDKKVQLYINTTGDLYHVGFKALELVTGSKTTKDKGGLGVELIPLRPGPMPQLNKPIVLNADGQVEQKAPEKSFFQKYWWVLAGFFVVQLLMAGGGGGKE